MSCFSFLFKNNRDSQTFIPTAVPLSEEEQVVPTAVPLSAPVSSVVDDRFEESVRVAQAISRELHRRQQERLVQQAQVLEAMSRELHRTSQNMLDQRFNARTQLAMQRSVAPSISEIQCDVVYNRQ